MSKASEVTFGESQEHTVLRRWMLLREIDPKTVRVIKSRAFQDWDFLLLDSEGFPLAYIEVKVRRKPLSAFGDAIAPIRKHEAAVYLQERRIRFLMVTQYPDALVQLDLAEEPEQRRSIRRKDRPGTAAIPHGLWAASQFEVLDGDG